MCPGNEGRGICPPNDTGAWQSDIPNSINFKHDSNCAGTAMHDNFRLKANSIKFLSPIATSSEYNYVIGGSSSRQKASAASPLILPLMSGSQTCLFL